MDSVGRRRHVLSLQEPVRLPDGAGGAEVTWTERARVFAAIEGLGGDMQAREMRAAARIQFRVTVRHRGDVQAGWRFVESGRELRIAAAFDPDGSGRSLVCLCEAEI